MSRVNSDDQRIQEMNEAQLRQQKQTEKRDQQERTTKSFNQVISERTQREQGKQLTEKQAAREEQAAKPRTDLARPKVLGETPRSPREAARRAAMFKEQAVGQNLRGAEHLSGAREAEGMRTTKLAEGASEERELLDREVRRDDLKDAQETDERFFSARTDGADGRAGANPPVDRDKGSRGQNSSKDDSAPVDEVKAKGAGGAGADRIPIELIDRIVSAIHTATQADGKTEVVVSLQGTMLDGVTLRVAAKKGKIRCTFEGCDKQTKNLIESSKGELMRALARKGLELDILRVK